MRFLLLCLSLVLAAPGSAAEESEWTLAVDEPNLTIHTRRATSDSIREFRAVTEIRASLESVMSIFEDVSRLPDWYDRCVEARRLAREEDADVIYVRTNLPFPVADRDIAFRNSTTWQGTDLVLYRAEAAPDLAPRTDGVVRVPEMTSTWKFRRISENRTQVQFQQRSHPGGAIPSWLANAMVTSMPRNSLRNLAQLVEGGASAPVSP